MRIAYYRNNFGLENILAGRNNSDDNNSDDNTSDDNTTRGWIDDNTTTATGKLFNCTERNVRRFRNANYH
jgi:hypothetical protein